MFPRGRGESRTTCPKTDPTSHSQSVKLCSKMSRPDAQDLRNMKRVGRFFVWRPGVGCLFEWQAHSGALHAVADADWAGDRQSRKSRQRGHDLAREAPDSRPARSSNATVRRQPCMPQSRWEIRRLPKTWVEPSRFGCTSTPVRHC